MPRDNPIPPPSPASAPAASAVPTVAVLTEDQLERLVGRAIEPLRREFEELRRHHQEGAITLEEAARELHVSRRTVQRWVKDGLLQSVAVGRIRRVRRADLQRLVG
jgi:excisionase family DNA binding protein